jgi:hypothetical protein
MHYPKWLYHRTEAARLVQDPDEESALGAEWAETPAAFAEQATHFPGVSKMVVPGPGDAPEKTRKRK